MPVNGILGKKVGMTQLFDDKGDVCPVTVLQAGPCVITQRKTATRDGNDDALREPMIWNMEPCDFGPPRK